MTQTCDPDAYPTGNPLPDINSNKNGQASHYLSQVPAFTVNRDTAALIRAILDSCGLHVRMNPVTEKEQRITRYEKIKLFGTDKELTLVEYDYQAGNMTEYPWKYQLLFTIDGRLLKSLSGQRVDLLRIFPEQAPFLLVLTVTARGNGAHQLYRMQADTLENVYDGYFYEIPTYDAHEDLAVLQPAELNRIIRDDNKDGWNDLVFTGNILLIEGRTKDGRWYNSEVRNGKTITWSVSNPFQKIPVEYVLLYHPQTGHFIPKEDYSENHQAYR